jgi:polyhydroxyalkanoate synthesis regulator phasin
MDSNTVIETLKKGVRVSLGATTAVVESLQDTQKREENLANLQLNPVELAELLATKGAKTEEEARKVMDDFLTQNGLKMNAPQSPNAESDPFRASTQSPSGIDGDLQQGLQNLTEELATIRKAILE